MNDKQFIINDVSKYMSYLVDKNFFDKDKYLSGDTVDLRQLAIDFVDCIKDTFDGRFLMDDEISFYRALTCKLICELNKRFL
jgi:hypothetical protein